MRRHSVIVVAALAMLAWSGAEALAQTCQTCWTNACPEMRGMVPACPKAKATPKPPSKTSSPQSAKGSCPSGMVHVPAGSFRMGSPKGTGDSTEHPDHQVTLAGYCIDETEVTVAAYRTCEAAGTCEALWTDGLMCNGKPNDPRPEHPVNCVTWDQARAYCSWAGKRLPTEAEWEHAARGDDARTYPWGDEPPSPARLNACGGECAARTRNQWGSLYSDDDGWAETAPVGSYRAGASPYGALDMAGNTEEWVADWYGALGSEPTKNPKGADSGEQRVYRGGFFLSTKASEVRSALRRWDYPNGRHGFRCARRD